MQPMIDTKTEAIIRTLQAQRDQALNSIAMLVGEIEDLKRALAESNAAREAAAKSETSNEP